MRLSTDPPPHMWPTLSMALRVMNMPDQFSCSMIAMAASATQMSPLWLLA